MVPELTDGAGQQPHHPNSACHDRSKAIAKRQLRKKLRRLPPAGPGQALPVFPDRARERLRYKGKKLRKWLEDKRAFRPCPFFQEFQDLTWTKFKQFGAAESDLFPWLIRLTEPQHSGMFERRRLRRPKTSDPFTDMPEPFKSKAKTIFARFCERWGWKRIDSRANYYQLRPTRAPQDQQQSSPTAQPGEGQIIEITASALEQDRPACNHV